MTDEFAEWDRFIEVFESAATADDAMTLYKKERRRARVRQEEAELRRYETDLARDRATER